MKTCEYHDRELNTKIVRVDVLETLLRDEIAKLEKSTVLRLRKSVHNEAKVSNRRYITWMVTVVSRD